MEGSDFPTEPEKSIVPASAVTVSETGVSTAVNEAREADHEVARAFDLTAVTPDNLQKFEEKSMNEQLLIMFSALPQQQQADMLSWQFTSQSDLFLGDDPAENETRGSSTETALDDPGKAVFVAPAAFSNYYLVRRKVVTQTPSVSGVRTSRRTVRSPSN